MSFRLDWSKFKKTGVDNGVATLKHDRGHEIRIALKALPPGTRKLLDSLPVHMAEGGEVAEKDQPEEQTENATPAAEAAAPVPVDTPQAIVQDAQAQAPQQPEPQAANQYADLYNTLVNNSINANPTIKDRPDLRAQAEADALDIVERRKNWDEAQKVKNVESQAMEAQRVAQLNARRSAIGLPPVEGSQAPAPDGAGQTASPTGQAPGSSTAMTPANPGNTAPQGSGGLMEGFGNAMNSGYQQQVKGINEQAAADSALGKQAAGIYGEQAAQSKGVLDRIQQVQADANAERQNFIHDVQKGYINPNHVMESMPAQNKVLLAIGMALSGAGAAAARIPDGAQQFLHDQIERDIKAQERNLGAKENLLQNNLQHYKNQQDALNMTRVQVNDYYSHLVDQAAAQNKTPQAQAMADKLKGELLQKNAFYLGQMGQSAGQLQSGGDPTAQRIQMYRLMGRKDLADDLQSRYIPGIGEGTKPVPEAVHSEIAAKQQLDTMAKDLYSWAQQHSGSVDPKTMAVGQTKAAELQSMYRNAIHGGVFKEGEQQFIDKLIDSDPTKFFNAIRVLPKLQEVIRGNQSQLNNLKKNYGLPGATGISSSSNKQISFTPKK